MQAGNMSEFSHSEKSANPGCCGSFQELSPTEFNNHKDLVVVLLRAERAVDTFEGFKGVIAAGCNTFALEQVAKLPQDQPIGLVCADGDCSGRLAIRLSNLGYAVFHLSGGLVEWYHSFRGQVAAHA